jgi:hypothetical protein
VTAAIVGGLRLDFLGLIAGLGVAASISSIKIAGFAGSTGTGMTDDPPNALTTESTTGVTAFFALEAFFGFSDVDVSADFFITCLSPDRV